MKYLTILPAIFLFACSDSDKQTAVSEGMNQQEVIQTWGEPSRKSDIKVAEIWVYKTQNKTLVFRADTVYDIVYSSTAGIDSIKNSFKDLGKDIKTGAKKIGKELDTVGQKLEGKLAPDTNDRRRE